MVAQISGNSALSDVIETFAKSVLSLPAAIPYYTQGARLALALVAVHRGDAAAAGDQYNALESERGIMYLYVSADRVLGLLSVILGRLDQAVAHFEDALALCREAGYRPELAWTCHDYAEALLVGEALRGRPGHPHRGAPTDPANRAKALSLLDEALAISTELGMRPLMERVVALRERVRLGGPQPAPAYPDGLTHREVEVLRLIAAGKTDREIAEALIISVRTVGNHVSNILNKTNTANRTEAATYAARHGLV